MFRLSVLTRTASSHLSTLVKLLTLLFAIVLLFGTIIHFLEPAVFPDLFDGVWWAIVTVSTVGYGDYVPESLIGRIIGVGLILTGVGTFSFYLGNVASSAVSTRDDIETGKWSFRQSGHILVVGWNERSRLLLDMIHRHNADQHVVLIDDSLERKPQSMNWLHFVRGSASHDQILQKANVSKAHTAIITADSHVDESTADIKTVLSILAIKSVNPDIYTIAEIVTEAQVKNARRAGADELVQSSLMLSSLMNNGPESHGVSRLMLTLLKKDTKNIMQMKALPEECIGLTYGQLIEDWRFDGEHLLGIWRDDTAELLPPDDYKLQEEDHLVVLLKKSGSG
ncbi:potassium channel family protein [Alteribacter natronophilus]|uniref:potassium channel family protein n=1 Tax=Alteribacter natronophilus TaxID=2583810 RepID=UPI00110D27B1|nr:potassium channel family protein [Alteribacter natronophilus]TMW71853.1 potassium channel family protein [Alteribacter natronophilus]